MFKSTTSIFDAGIKPTSKPVATSNIFSSNHPEKNNNAGSTSNVFGSIHQKPDPKPNSSEDMFKGSFAYAKKRLSKDSSVTYESSKAKKIKQQGNKHGKYPSRSTATRGVKEAGSEVTQAFPSIGASTEEKSLLEVMRRPAPSDHEKYLVLDARDKWMRLKGLGQRHKLLILRGEEEDAEDHLKGICPDMCPEKERYSRSAKNQLRVYEKMRNDACDPSTMLKEYSRSSADQDVPLPHELRPSSVLQMCMQHLLRNIIDRLENSDENLADWFEFVWSSTRAIRKDITQQQLHDRQAIQLVETCARFHIVCAARLVDSTLAMDSKLNNENLNACLQMVFQMYEDCDHEPESCVNEPEFRAYHVLINLNEPDDYMINSCGNKWQLKVVKELFMAFNSSNYARFFKLVVNKADLLQSCLLLRYFDQVRCEALERMVRAYCPKVNAKARIEVTKLTNLFMFEDDDHCLRFFNHHHMSVDGDNNVVLNRTAYYTPNQPLPIQRSHRLVESKRGQLSWSQVINGGRAVEEVSKHVVHNSFDDEDRLMVEAYTASDIDTGLETGSDRTYESIEENVEHHEEVLSGYHFEDQGEEEEEMPEHEDGNEVDDSCDEDELDGIDEDEENEFKVKGNNRVTDSSELNENCWFTNLVEEQLLDVSDEVLSSEVKTLAKEVLKEARNEELRRRIETEIAKNQADEVASNCFDDLLTSIVTELVVEEQQRQKAKREQVMKLDQFLVENVFTEVVVEQVRIAISEILVDVNRDNFLVDKLQSKMRRRQMQRLFQKWLNLSRKRRLLRDFPACPSRLEFSDQLNRLGRSTDEISEASQITSVKKVHECAESVDHLWNCIQKSDELLHRLLKQPIDLIDLTERKVRDKRQPVIGSGDSWGFKCLLLLPSILENEKSRGERHNMLSRRNLLHQVIRHKLSWEQKAFESLDRSILQRRSKGRCSCVVREITDEVIEDELALSEKKRRDVLWGTKAIIAVHVDGEDIIEETVERVRHTINLLPKFPAVPVALASTSSSALSCLRDALKDLDSNSTIIEALFPANIFDARLNQALDECLLNILSVSSLQRPRISEMSLRELIYTALDKFVWTKVNQLDLPRGFTTLFNALLGHLQRNVLSQPVLAEFSYPVAEMVVCDSIPVYWSETYYIDVVCERIDVLKMDDNGNDEIIMAEDDVNDIHGQILDWTKKMVYNGCSKSGFELDCINSVSESVWKKHKKPLNSVWLDVLRIVVAYKLSLLDDCDPFGNGVLRVAFVEDDFNNFSFDIHNISLNQRENKRTKKTVKSNFDASLGQQALEESKNFEALLERALGLLNN